jgi:hypothetical protein
MSTILVSCRRCGAEFAPDREAIVAGAWRLCPECRGGEGEPHEQGHACPRCDRWLKSGTHRSGCPGRRRRNRGVLA